MGKVGTQSWGRVCPVLLAPTEQLDSPLPRKLFTGAYSFKADIQREGKGRAPQPEDSFSRATTHGSGTLYSPVPMNSLVAMVTSNHSNCITRGHPHAQDRLAFRGTAPNLSGVWGPVGSELLCLPGPHITVSQGNRVIGASRTQSPPQRVSIVSKQPGPGPQGHCRNQLGPAEG